MIQSITYYDNKHLNICELFFSYDMSLLGMSVANQT